VGHQQGSETVRGLPSCTRITGTGGSGSRPSGAIAHVFLCRPVDFPDRRCGPRRTLLDPAAGALVSSDRRATAISRGMEGHYYALGRAVWAQLPGVAGRAGSANIGETPTASLQRLVDAEQDKSPNRDHQAAEIYFPIPCRKACVPQFKMA
jgi:hypothetical protein